MIETGDGAAAFYTDIMQTVINLALAAPGGPPTDAASFLDRLDSRLARIGLRRRRPRSGHDPHPRRPAHIWATSSSAAPPCSAASARPWTAPAPCTDADVWYCILEGTREHSVAETQAMALTELVAHAATDPGTERRAILLAADDYSAVSRRVPISQPV